MNKSGLGATLCKQMQIISRSLAALMVAVLIQPAPLVATEPGGLVEVCCCCGGDPCDGCECVSETEREAPVPFSAERAETLCFPPLPSFDGVALSAPKWRREPRGVRPGTEPAPSGGRYCGRSCALRL